MYETDTSITRYPKGYHIFAEAFNYFLYGDKPIIQPEQLHPLNPLTTSLWWEKSLLPEMQNSLSYLTAMEDDTTIYMMLAMDKQAKHPKDAPSHNVLCDALAYEKQVWEIAARHYVTKDPNASL